ncbi:MAG: hypothetical protein KKD75_06225, partial [Nanoarchaeota archaeon]|nr:hypothetical protein [Nanoarchaeota archaeon]MBU1631579.1 hypothetical protein [Nanoarchaeota archaeon]MBU1876125.1 hypothetical protein [Nanoarchaeota archaeon]
YSYGVDFEKPTSCGNKENTACICLLKDFESKFDSTGLGTYTIKPKDAACNELSMRINFSSCGIGSPHKVSEYSCNDGFIIERNLIKKAISSPKDSYFEAPRRVSITMKKEGNVIVLEK